MGATAARFFVTPRRTIKVNSYDLGPGETYASRPALVDEKERKQYFIRLHCVCNSNEKEKRAVQASSELVV